MTSEHTPVTNAALDAEYEILRELGRGGTAVVYLARERATGVEVAIKVIRSRYIDDDEAQARFAREARLVAQLHHPNIVPVRAVLDLGTAGLAIVMGHVVGRTLKERIKQEGPLAPEDATQVLRDIGSALDAAHATGIVHRDVKPENIFIDDRGRALLADFGLARSMTPDTALTMAGVALGTPAYMAPEQIDGNDLDARVDVYSLGLVAWEMLVGRRAWSGEGLFAILYHQKHEVPPDVRELRDDVPDRLAEVIARAVEKRRDARWGSVREMLDALEESSPLMLVPRAVVGTSGGDTIRFMRPPVAAAESPQVVELADLAAELHSLEMPRRRLPAIRRTATVVGTLSVAALAVMLVRRADVPASAATKQAMLPVLQGDVSRPVSLPARRDTQVARPDTARARVAAPAAQPAASAADMPKLTPATENAGKPSASSDSAPPLPVTMPALPARPRIIVGSVVEKVLAPDSSASAVWGGPTPLKPKASIVAGGTHSCLVSAAGKAVCWGGNDHGQLSELSSDGGSMPVSVDIQPQFVALTAGTAHTCALTRDGAAMCWGNNQHGQSGDRSLGSKVPPGRVLDAHVFWSIAAGDEHTCAVDEYGSPWCWGSNAAGQLGEPSITESAVPVLVGKGAIRFVSITAGSTFTCGLSANGRASCWGENGAGQLGDGSNFDRSLPVAVASGTYTSIAAGSNHVCALTAEGEAYCWGRNTFGQVGDGGSFDRNVPVRVRGRARFKSITAGGNHTCAVTVDGAAYCWGQNTYGQLGTGGAADVAQPSPVADGHVFASVNAYGTHTCGLTTSGEAFCWGNNAQNQLGDGTRTHRVRPTLVAGVRDR
jgi:alpha-tubulin suppressor-like RCC1 family protein/tRNA A-37 threonylcarbamoyl transferase component Bud32